MNENDKFTKHYISAANATVTDAILRNVAMQAKISELNEILDEHTKTIMAFAEYKETASNTIQEMGEEIRKLVEERDSIKQTHESNGAKVRDYELQIFNIMHELQEAKNKASHIDTFRNQLLDTQNKLSEKDDEISKLTDIVKEMQPKNDTSKKTVVATKQSK